mmetsp:Transcript_46630/g.101322  ORF Transcript_46630/g.101322 Transcript_46630/m.101322 type:complete len:294 (-) Transcript_46630:25-906(-)
MSFSVNFTVRSAAFWSRDTEATLSSFAANSLLYRATLPCTVFFRSWAALSSSWRSWCALLKSASCCISFFFRSSSFSCSWSTSEGAWSWMKESGSPSFLSSAAKRSNCDRFVPAARSFLAWLISRFTSACSSPTFFWALLKSWEIPVILLETARISLSISTISALLLLSFCFTSTTESSAAFFSSSKCFNSFSAASIVARCSFLIVRQLSAFTSWAFLASRLSAFRAARRLPTVFCKFDNLLHFGSATSPAAAACTARKPVNLIVLFQTNVVYPRKFKGSILSHDRAVESAAG